MNIHRAPVLFIYRLPCLICTAGHFPLNCGMDCSARLARIFRFDDGVALLIFGAPRVLGGTDGVFVGMDNGVSILKGETSLGIMWT
jgi:hypothetical protein